MKSTCPHCGTTYRIDPRKVPAGGVHARCSKCSGVFEVASPAAEPVSVDARGAPGRLHDELADADRPVVAALRPRLVPPQHGPHPGD